MTTKERQRIQLLANQLIILLVQSQECIVLMEKTGVIGGYCSVGQLKRDLLIISQSLSAFDLKQGTQLSQDSIAKFQRAIVMLGKKTYDFGWTNERDTRKQICHFARPVMPYTICTMLIDCARAILLVVDKITHLATGSKIYNEQGETPFALSLMGTLQFFPRPTRTVFCALNELRKASNIMQETLLNIKDDKSSSNMNDPT